MGWLLVHLRAGSWDSAWGGSITDVEDTSGTDGAGLGSSWGADSDCIIFKSLLLVEHSASEVVGSTQFSSSIAITEGMWSWGIAICSLKPSGHSLKELYQQGGIRDIKLRVSPLIQFFTFLVGIWVCWSWFIKGFNSLSLFVEHTESFGDWRISKENTIISFGIELSKIISFVQDEEVTTIDL